MSPVLAMNANTISLLALALAPATSAQHPQLDAPNLLWPQDAGWPLAVGDVDGDGDADAVAVVTSTSSTTQLLLLTNDGSGGPRVVPGAMPAVSPAVFPQRAAIFDADGDGDADVVAVGLYANLLFLQGPGGSFADASAALGASTGLGFDLAVFDRNLDGYLDLVFANETQNRLLDNQGGAAFTDATAALPVDPSPTATVRAGDLDGDGDPDLLLSGACCLGPAFAPAFAIDRLALQSAGTFAYAPFPQPPGGQTGGALEPVDADGDGDLDVVAVGLAGTFVHLNDGAAGFTPGSALVPPPRYGKKLQVGDVDGDGIADVLATTSGGSTLFAGDGAGGFTASWSVPSPFGAAFPLVDLDGDGDLDVAASSHEGPLLNDGHGRLVDSRGGAALIAGSLELAIGDVDGDGFDDILAMSLDHDTRLLLNDGGFHDPKPAQALPRASDGALGDVDGDGDLDLLLAPPSLQCWTGTEFVDASASLPPTATAVPDRAVLGDVDGDGHLDAVLLDVGAAWAPASLWLGDGVGGFADATAQLGPISGAQSDVELGDVDGDGDLDLLVVGQSLLLSNDGTGTFGDASANLPATSSASRAVFFDPENDGDLDVAACWMKDALLWRNDGTGAFVDVSAAMLPPPASLTYDVTALTPGDFDGDGSPDLYVAMGLDLTTLLGGQARLLLGDGTGAFHESAGLLPVVGEAHWAAPITGDLDGDLDLDLVATSSWQSGIRANLTRHVARRGPARIGKTMFVEVFGPSGEPYTLACALAKASIELPGFGHLGLDPTAIVLFAGGMLDANGAAVVSIPVPNDPALLGTDTRWQALVGAQPRFTNAERTVPTAL